MATKMVSAKGSDLKGIFNGARVRLLPPYGTGTKYFVTYLSGSFCLIADGKRDLRNDTGHIYSVYDIKAYETLA